MIFAVLIYFERSMDVMNTTVFAFSYEHGFISRGVLGTFLQIWDSLSPVDLLSYHTVYQISEAATALYLLMLLLFVASILKHCNQEDEIQVKWISLLLLFLSVPMFLTCDNFGRLDVYLMILTLFCMILLVSEKFEFLIIPAVTFATIIHQGYVFMNLNIILAVLFYKFLMKRERRDKIKYGILLLLSFLLPSIFFLYFEFFSHTFGTEIYQEIFTLAQKLSSDGVTVHEQVLQHEILGNDIYGMEEEFHRWNREDLPIFLVLFSPFLVFGIRFFRDYAKKNKTVAEKWTGLAVLIAPLTLLPEILLKVDFGRYIFSICFYYLAIVLMLMALKDQQVITTVKTWRDKMAAHKLMACMALLYLFLFLPFRGYRICDAVTTIVSIIFKN